MKSIFISIIGRTNAGKSTLLNRLCGEKIAIVTPKPQTTRTRIMGVLTRGETQLVFVDTPGLHNAKTRLGENMLSAAKDSLDGVDVVLAVADVTKAVFEFPPFGSSPAILVLNKVDLAKPAEIAEKIAAYSAARDYAAVVPVSALLGAGEAELFSEIEKFATDHPHYFPEDTLTDQPERVMIAELMREKLMLALRDEVPHGIAVMVEKMQERGKITDIFINIYVERESHKGMVVGKGGALIKAASTAARADIERLLERRVNLQTFVKLKENWRENERYIREFKLNN